MKAGGSFTKTLEIGGKRLITLINEFLEVEVEGEHLLANSSMIADYRKLLVDNLSPFDDGGIEPNWRTELKRIADESNESEYIKRAAHMISTIHLLLKPIWDDLKDELPKLPIPYNEVMATQRYLLGVDLLDKVIRNVFNKIKEIIYETEDSGFSFADSAFKDFIHLLLSVNLGDFKKCRNKDCKNWFIWNSELKKQKIYCSDSCRGLDNSRKKSSEDKKKYMQDYRAKKKAKKSSKGMAKTQMI